MDKRIKGRMMVRTRQRIKGDIRCTLNRFYMNCDSNSRPPLKHFMDNMIRNSLKTAPIREHHTSNHIYPHQNWEANATVESRIVKSMEMVSMFLVIFSMRASMRSWMEGFSECWAWTIAGHSDDITDQWGLTARHRCFGPMRTYKAPFLRHSVKLEEIKYN